MLSVLGPSDLTFCTVLLAGLVNVFISTAPICPVRLWIVLSFAFKRSILMGLTLGTWLVSASEGMDLETTVTFFDAVEGLYVTVRFTPT